MLLQRYEGQARVRKRVSFDFILSTYPGIIMMVEIRLPNLHHGKAASHAWGLDRPPFHCIDMAALRYQWT